MPQTEPLANQLPQDLNSGKPRDKLLETGQALIAPAPNTAPGMPPEPPLTRDLLYKGARYPALYKAGMALIGEVKHQPSCMKVTACGEGDTSGLKEKPWQVNGPTAWEGIKVHK